MTCQICQFELHTQCYANHSPCPDGWLSKEQINKELLGDLNQAAPDLPGAVTPPSLCQVTCEGTHRHTSGTFSEATTIYKKFLADMEEITTRQNSQQQYPQSPARPGTTGLVPLANLGVAPGATGHSGFAVQYGKPREADSVKLKAFPKPGTSFEVWWDHALDSISSSTSYCTEAYRWALECGKPETTFAALSESGGFVRLDALLLTALMECISGDRISCDKTSKRPRQSSARFMNATSLAGKSS